MGFRFRKSFGAGPFRINLSKSGIGYSVGGKGFRYTKKAGGGTRTTVSIPGTGISYVQDSKKEPSKVSSSNPQSSSMAGTLATKKYYPILFGLAFVYSILIVPYFFSEGIGLGIFGLFIVLLLIASAIKNIRDYKKYVQMAANAPFQFISLTKSVRRNGIASVKIKGKPLTAYGIRVEYNGHESSADGIKPVKSNKKGIAYWSWKVGGRTAPGEAKIYITDGQEGRYISFSVV